MTSSYSTVTSGYERPEQTYVQPTPSRPSNDQDSVLRFSACDGRKDAVVALGCSRSYLVCSSGKTVEMNCPEGLVYNELASICDHPRNVVECSPSSGMHLKCLTNLKWFQKVLSVLALTSLKEEISLMTTNLLTDLLTLTNLMAEIIQSVPPMNLPLRLLLLLTLLLARHTIVCLNMVCPIIIVMFRWMRWWISRSLFG